MTGLGVDSAPNPDAQKGFDTNFFDLRAVRERKRKLVRARYSNASAPGSYLGRSLLPGRCRGLKKRDMLHHCCKEAQARVRGEGGSLPKPEETAQGGGGGGGKRVEGKACGREHNADRTTQYANHAHFL